MTKKKPKIIKPTAPFKVGIYQLGFRWCEIWIKPGKYGGEFTWLPDECRDPQKPKQPCRIDVGAPPDQPLWSAWGVLTHEAMESLLCDLSCRYRHTNTFNRDTSDCYIFHFNHNQFTEACARLGSFLCECREDFEKAWKRCQAK